MDFIDYLFFMIKNGWIAIFISGYFLGFYFGKKKSAKFHDHTKQN